MQNRFSRDPLHFSINATMQSLGFQCHYLTKHHVHQPSQNLSSIVLHFRRTMFHVGSTFPNHPLSARPSRNVALCQIIDAHIPGRCTINLNYSTFGQHVPIGSGDALLLYNMWSNRLVMTAEPRRKAGRLVRQPINVSICFNLIACRPFGRRAHPM